MSQPYLLARALTEPEGQPPSGAVEMHEVQAAYIASGSGGSGTLYYQGEVTATRTKLRKVELRMQQPY
jgi:hypothetical protein